MAPFVEDFFLPSALDPTLSVYFTMSNDPSLTNFDPSLFAAPCFRPTTTTTTTTTTNTVVPNGFDWTSSTDLPSDLIESLADYLANSDNLPPSLSPSSATSADEHHYFSGSSISSPASSPLDWWTAGSSTIPAFDQYGVVPTSAFAVANSHSSPTTPTALSPLPTPQQLGGSLQRLPATVLPELPLIGTSSFLQVPQQRRTVAPPPLPVNSTATAFGGDGMNLAQCDPLAGKRVSFKATANAEPEVMSIKELYARVREPVLCASLVRKSHPIFDTLDEAVGHFYILKDVRARKPPAIGNERFNCHTRRDAGDAHWQYNVPNTDFTCRVSQWVKQSTFESATYTSYHYYRSPTPRRTHQGRFSPY